MSDARLLADLLTITGDWKIDPTGKSDEAFKLVMEEIRKKILELKKHAFDMLKPELQVSKEAAAKFNLHFEYALKHYFAEN